MARVQFIHKYDTIISLENLLAAWGEFINGKKSRKDVQWFGRNLMTNVISLHKELSTKNYNHSPYHAFSISDPKPRNIHKAAVRDRLLHHALHRALYPFFDRTFISDSFSCRNGKGTHKALDRFKEFSFKVSKNYTKTAWVLKCDIKKFFATINQAKLIEIVSLYIPDKGIVDLLSKIIGSFYSTATGIGLPLGNLTSQLLVNVYMNEFDQYVKHKLKAKYYIRYADDFVFMSDEKKELEELLPKISSYLSKTLHLRLHPDKVFMRTLASGIDFLGWVHFPDHRVLRTATKRRMFKGIEIQQGKEEVVQSYTGLLSHGNGWKLQKQLIDSHLN